jgi:hypothetical protein
VKGVLKTLFSGRGVLGDRTVEGEVDCVDETVNSPTKALSAATIAGYSKPEVSPRPIGFQDSLK